MCHHFAAVFFISLVHIFFPYSECMDAGFVAFLFELLDFFFCESHIHGSGGFFYLFYFRDANDRKGAFGKGLGDGGLGRGDVMRFPDFLQGCKDAVQFVHDAVVALSSSASFWHEVVFVILASEGALFEDHVSVEGDALFFAIVQDACTFGRPVEKAVMVLHGCDVKAFCRKDFLCSFDFF